MADQHWIIESRSDLYASSPWLPTRWHLDRSGDQPFSEEWEGVQNGYDTRDRAAATARMETLAGRFHGRVWRVAPYAAAPTDAHPGITAEYAERVRAEATAVRRAHRLTPAMERMLTDTRRRGTGALGADRRTQRALIARGLAEPVIGRAEVRARGQAPGQTTTVHDAYLGAAINAEGSRAASRLALAARLAEEIRERAAVRA